MTFTIFFFFFNFVYLLKKILFTINMSEHRVSVFNTDLLSLMK